MTTVSDIPAITNDAAPAISAVALTATDGVQLAITRALYIGTAGDVTVVMAGVAGNITFKNVPVGIFPIRIRELRATGTTALQIVALY